jgi:hypothetical protein
MQLRPQVRRLSETGGVPMTSPTTEQPLTEPAQQTGQRVASKHVRCPVCGWPLEITSDSYPSHGMFMFGCSGVKWPNCPRSGKPFDPSAPALAVNLPWDRS